MNDNKTNKAQITRLVVAVIVMMIIAAIHTFRLGSYLEGELYIYYYSYASDIMLPFGAYFLLCMNEVQIPQLRKWYIKASIVFGAMTLSEILQYFGIFFFGVTFDIIDIFMYALGTLLAVLIDRQIFSRWIPSWGFDESKRSISD